MAKILTYTGWSDYLRQRAIDIPELGHTAQVPHYYQLEAAFSGTQLNSPALIGMPFIGRLSDAKSDNIHKDISGEFLVVLPCRMEDFDAQTAAYDLAMVVADKIISKMLADLKSFAAEKPFYFFDINMVTWAPIGPEFNDNCFGVHYNVPFSNPKNF